MSTEAGFSWAFSFALGPVDRLLVQFARICAPNYMHEINSRSRASHLGREQSTAVPSGLSSPSFKFFAEPYFLFGFRAGFRFKNKMTIFVEATNLTNERYPSDLEPIPDARTADGPIEVFHPGDGRSFYAGLSWAL